MVKLSPMLDMASALRDLKYIRELHVIAVNNECKELTLSLSDDSVIESSEKEIVISCEQAVHNSLSEPFTYTLSEEKNAVCQLADRVETYLYEPGAALLKAGPYRLLSQRYGVKKLHPNSHFILLPYRLISPDAVFR